MSKELYIEEHERLVAELEDQGVPFAEAYERTADAAYDAMRDRFADMADAARQRMKDEGR